VTHPVETPSSDDAQSELPDVETRTTTAGDAHDRPGETPDPGDNLSSGAPGTVSEPGTQPDVTVASEEQPSAVASDEPVATESRAPGTVAAETADADVPAEPGSAAAGSRPDNSGAHAAGEEGGTPPTSTESGAGGFWAFARETAIVLVTALVLSLLIKTFLVQAFFIPSQSMENTLLVGDRVLVSKLTPGPFDLDRGDIVVFKDPGGWLPLEPAVEEGPFKTGVRDLFTFVGLLPSDSGEHLIKRVIGVGGDTVECCDAQGRLMVNGQAIDETQYLHPGVEPSAESFKVTVPEGRLWVMGDNRNNSRDSRANRGEGKDGTIPVDNVVGRAFVLVWPADRFRWLTNPSSVFEDVPEH
jgi:signal peptidase I